MNQQTTKAQLHVRINAELFRALKHLAVENGTPLGYVVEDLLRIGYTIMRKGGRAGEIGKPRKARA